MKNLTPLKLKLLALSLFVTALSATAQKLPNVQKSGVYAPAGVKVDGKTNEWNNKFEAANSATNLAYTMANDGDKLYLTIQATDASAMNKLLMGGVKLTIKSPDKTMKPVVINALLFQPKGLTGVQQKIKAPDAKMDSLLGPINDQVAAALKEIGVTGIADITDTLISVYNEYGIKEAVQFDKNKALNVEIAIPLKFISQLINADTFKYNIMLNGIKMGNISIVLNGSPVAAGSVGAEKATTMITQMSMSGGGGSFQDAFNATDFSGSYTLVKR